MTQVSLQSPISTQATFQVGDLVCSDKLRKFVPKALSIHNDSSLPSVFEKYGVGWMKEDDGSEYVLRSPAIDLHAPIERVWELVSDLNRYAQFSDNAVDADVDGDLLAGREIELRIFPEKCVGKIMGKSKEHISVNDSEMKIIGWTRSLPLGGGDTERYHILVPVGPELTRSYIGLKVPGLFGSVSSALFGNTILKAFSALNQGIKAEAER